MKNFSIPTIAISVCAIIATTITATATPVSAKDAAIRAIQHLDRQGARKIMPADQGLSGLEYAFGISASSGNDETDLYVFNAKGNRGYIIAPADNAAAPVIGYSDNGSLSPDDMPENMKAWLNSYCRQIKWLREHNISTDAQSTLPAGERDIAPLITTLWEQASPFNKLMPTVEIDGKEYNYFTGCVPTSMAQVIKFHRYPLHGNGSHTYTANTGQTLTFDYESTSFDYDNMADSYVYEEGWSDESADAVATLMLACAVGAEASFSLGGTGSSSDQARISLERDFGYDCNMRLIARMQYLTPEWEKLIYEELVNKRPVIYGGNSENGGHSFICDGYSHETNMFHINWGWGGSKNGYFTLSELNPSLMLDPSYFNENDNFYMAQDAIIGIQPSTGQPRQLHFKANNSIKRITDNQFKILNIPTAGGHILIPENEFDSDYFQLGFRIADDSGNEYFAFSEPIGKSLYYWKPWAVDIPSLEIPEGRFTMYPAFRISDESTGDIEFPIGAQSTLILTVGPDGTKIFSEPGADIDMGLTLTGFEAGEIYKNQEFDFSATCTYDEQYSWNIQLSGYIDITRPDESKVLESIGVNFSTDGHAITNTGIIGLNPGSYDLHFYNMFGTGISDKAYKIDVLGREGTIPFEIVSPSPTLYHTKQYQFSTTLGEEYADEISWSTEYDPDIPSSVYGPIDNTGLYSPRNSGHIIISAKRLDWEARYPADILAYTGVFQIYFEESVYNLAVGDFITPPIVFIPEDASIRDVTYSSSDENIATVDDTGHVECIAPGRVTITARSTDNPEAYDICYLNIGQTVGQDLIVKQPLSVGTNNGEIIISGNGAAGYGFELYNLNGCLIRQGTASRISRLESGLYFLRINGNTYKVYVR